MLLGANDGTLINLHDRAYAKPLRLQNVEKPTPPPAETPKSEEPKPEKPLPGSKPPAEPAKPADKPANPAAPPAKPGDGGADKDKG
jgi:hypothetical protein